MDEVATNNDATANKFFRYFRREQTGEFHAVPSYFSAKLNISLQAIEGRITDLKADSKNSDDRNHAIERCQAEIMQLSNEVRNASSNVPARERRTYAEAITSLQQKLKEAQDAVAPRRKFAFKAGSSRTVKTNDNTATTSTLTQSDSTTKDEISSSILTPTKVDSPSLNRCENAYINLHSPSNGTAGSGSLSNLHRCVVHPDTVTHQVPNLVLKSVSSSLMICGRVNGPVHLTNITDSIMVVSSQQFRMHDSRDCDVYLHTSSRPIIEHCSGIRFAPLPDTYRDSWGNSASEDGQWQQVDDFNWHRGEHSPNWSTLEPEGRIANVVWQDAAREAHAGSGKTVDDVLKAVNL